MSCIFFIFLLSSDGTLGDGMGGKCNANERRELRTKFYSELFK